MPPFIIFLMFLAGAGDVCAHLQDSEKPKWWHGIERSIHYRPEGTDFVCVNGKRRFTRAIYGSNTAFRVEAGDLPEFALYMPGMGGNLKFGLASGDSSMWLINAKSITARYRPGSMIYEIEDDILGGGKIQLVVLAMAKAEGMILSARFEGVSTPLHLICAFGGATSKKFSRDGDMGPDPEGSFYLKPEYCRDNNYTIDNSSFRLGYGTGLLTEPDPYVNRDASTDSFKTVKAGKEQVLNGIFPPGFVLHIADAIDDRGLRELAGAKNQIELPQGIPFATPSDTSKSNILFTSQWDNYPREAVVPLSGRSSHPYLLLAGSTNPMQSRLTNGAIYVAYTDGSSDSLLLLNPQTWWPIEQDYMDDGFAFRVDAPLPVRVHLKTGLIASVLDNRMAKLSGKMIDGGAATVLDLALNPSKTLKQLKLVTVANDVVIGLMAVTLLR